MTPLRLLDEPTIRSIVAQSHASTRGRANHNLHPTLDDPYQRFLNVLQPGSYVRPHRHEPDRFELFVLLRGRAAALLLDGAGAILGHAVLAEDGARAVEIPGDAWHTVLALAPDTVLFEVKPGPYRPLEDKDFASWAPLEGEPGAADLLRRWEALIADVADS